MHGIAESLGVPEAAVTIALAVYGLCLSAESVASKQALYDIGSFLTKPRRAYYLTSSQLSLLIFRWALGDNLSSWILTKKFLVFMTLSNLCLFAFSLFITRQGHLALTQWGLASAPIGKLAGLFIWCSLLPGYLSVRTIRGVIIEAQSTWAKYFLIYSFLFSSLLYTFAFSLSGIAFVFWNEIDSTSIPSYQWIVFAMWRYVLSSMLPGLVATLILIGLWVVRLFIPARRFMI